MTTTIKVKFRPSTAAGRPGSIVYLVTHRRVVRQITTEYKIYPDEWSAKQTVVVPMSDNIMRVKAVQSIKRKLNWDLERLRRIVSHFEKGIKEYSSDEIVDEYRRVTKENSLFCYMENAILRLMKLNHTGTANNYRAALGSFRRFSNGEDVMLEAVDHVLMEYYQLYLKQQELAPNSISFYMRILRAVYNRAVEEELTQDRKPFRNVFTGMEKTVKRAISMSDVKRIKSLELQSRPNLEFARDVFLFLFYCRGMSFIDAAFLRKTDIQNDVLSYRRHKTGQLLHIKVVRQISELIERYTHKESPYLLPIITIPGKDERLQYESALRRINNALKTIARMLKLPIPLTTYVSRHAWATIAKSKNIPVNVISDALGHDSISTTQIYLASIDTSTIDTANELIIKDL